MVWVGLLVGFGVLGVRARGWGPPWGLPCLGSGPVGWWLVLVTLASSCPGCGQELFLVADPPSQLLLPLLGLAVRLSSLLGCPWFLLLSVRYTPAAPGWLHLATQGGEPAAWIGALPGVPLLLGGASVRLRLWAGVLFWALVALVSCRPGLLACLVSVAGPSCRNLDASGLCLVVSLLVCQSVPLVCDSLSRFSLLGFPLWFPFSASRTLCPPVLLSLWFSWFAPGCSFLSFVPLAGGWCSL